MKSFAVYFFLWETVAQTGGKILIFGIKNKRRNGLKLVIKNPMLILFVLPPKQHARNVFQRLNFPNNYQENFINHPRSDPDAYLRPPRQPGKRVLRWEPKFTPINSTVKSMAVPPQPFLNSKSQLVGHEAGGPVSKGKELTKAQPIYSRCRRSGHLGKECKNMVRCRSELWPQIS